MRLRELAELAYEAHSGQVDKAGKPYILHPLMVTLNLRSKVAKLKVFEGVSEETLQHVEKACISHDLIEDTSITIDLLRECGLEEPVIEGVIGLTKIEGEFYSDFISRSKLNIVSHMGKVCDILENLDIDRIPVDARTVHDLDRVMKYRTALSSLGVEESEMEWLLTYY